MTKRKICMLGAFAAGKTSLVQRLVSSIFSEKYLTTVGVKIDKKIVRAGGFDVNLVIWDVQGEDPVRETPAAYLRGAAGCLLVVDGTRRDTVSVAQAIRERVKGQLGDVPFVMLLNKADLVAEWEIDDGTVEELDRSYRKVFRTSARTGEGVEEAFLELTEAIMAHRAPPPVPGQD